MKSNGRFGDFGGIFVPEILFPAVEELEAAFLEATEDSSFHAELSRLLTEYAGRPTPLYHCANLCKETGVDIYLKREDLLHGGAHKTNQVLGQALLAKRIGKTRIIAETGAGQHGVATAIAGALFGFETRIYMGAVDVKRQELNVLRMQLMGAEVIPVESGTKTLKSAMNEALRDWSKTYDNTHYLVGTAAGPHPFPTIVREFQRVIGKEAKAQIKAAIGRLPDAVIACVGGGSNAIGIFADFIDEPSVRLIGAEAAGHGLHTDQHAASLARGRKGVLHGAHSLLLQDAHGQIEEAYSISAGLDYPGIGPEHCQLQATGRAEYVGVTDEEALAALRLLAECEGIIPALESSHAVAHAVKTANTATSPMTLIVNVSGRGDKDMEIVRGYTAEKGALPSTDLLSGKGH